MPVVRQGRQRHFTGQGGGLFTGGAADPQQDIGKAHTNWGVWFVHHHIGSPDPLVFQDDIGNVLCQCFQQVQRFPGKKISDLARDLGVINGVGDVICGGCRPSIQVQRNVSEKILAGRAFGRSHPMMPSGTNAADLNGV
jgi:hypothetical protein